jgi:hypothetical protein
MDFAADVHVALFRCARLSNLTDYVQRLPQQLQLSFRVPLNSSVSFKTSTSGLVHIIAKRFGASFTTSRASFEMSLASKFASAALYHQ